MDISGVEQHRIMDEFVFSLREDTWPQVRVYFYIPTLQRVLSVNCVIDSYLTHQEVIQVMGC